RTACRYPTWNTASSRTASKFRVERAPADRRGGDAVNKLLCAAAAAILLSGCDRPEAGAPAPVVAPVPSAAKTAPADVPVAQPSDAPASSADAADKTTDEAIDNALGDHAR